jgi:hypothetical protein
MRSRARPGVPAAAVAPGTASPAAGRPTGLPLIAAMLIAAAALDLTRCSLILMTFRHVAPTVGLVAAGIGAAVVSVTAARGYRAGQRWAAWAALLIGVASAPQASASGFRNPYTIPDVATAALGVLLTVAILATVGRTGQPVQHLEIPCVMSRDGRLSSSRAPAPPVAPPAPPADRSQARSAVFAVSDDVEEHPPECLQLALAEAVQDRCLDAVAGAGHFRAQGVSCLGDLRDSRATVARMTLPAGSVIPARASRGLRTACPASRMCHQGLIGQDRRLRG